MKVFLTDGYIRVDNITDATLTNYRKTFGATVTKDDIFASIYGLMHSEDYRTEFQAELKRQFPRVPLLEDPDSFWSFVDAGEKLLKLHIGYETVTPYPLDEEHAVQGETPDSVYYRFKELKWDGNRRNPDRSRLVYNENLTLTGIPNEAHEYMVGTRSALDWLIYRYKVDHHEESGIIDDPYDWACEMGNYRYFVDLVKRVVTVSVETVRITRNLPKISNL